MIGCLCNENRCGRCCAGGCPISIGIPLLSGELELLDEFSRYPFLPVAQGRNGSPIYLEGSWTAAEYSAVLSSMRDKGLIRIDYDIPLVNFDYSRYQDCIHHGSMALTAFGQDVIEQIGIHGHTLMTGIQEDA